MSGTHLCRRRSKICVCVCVCMCVCVCVCALIYTTNPSEKASGHTRYIHHFIQGKQLNDSCLHIHQNLYKNSYWIHWYITTILFKRSNSMISCLLLYTAKPSEKATGHTGILPPFYSRKTIEWFPVCYYIYQTLPKRLLDTLVYYHHFIQGKQLNDFLFVIIYI